MLSIKTKVLDTVDSIPDMTAAGYGQLEAVDM